jgi:hypothetical protein
MSDELVIVHSIDLVQRQRTRDDFVREVTEIADLLSRESDAAKLNVSEREQRRRLRVAVREERGETSMDRSRRLS